MLPILIADGTEVADPAEMAAIDVFNDRLQAQGYWVYANGLADPSTATVVDGRGAQPVFTDGPFVESKEFLAADLLRRLGRNQESHAAYDTAIELAGSTAEIAYLTRRRDELG